MNGLHSSPASVCPSLSQELPVPVEQQQQQVGESEEQAAPRESALSSWEEWMVRKAKEDRRQLQLEEKRKKEEKRKQEEKATEEAQRKEKGVFMLSLSEEIGLKVDHGMQSLSRETESTNDNFLGSICHIQRCGKKLLHVEHTHHGQTPTTFV